MGICAAAMRISTMTLMIAVIRSWDTESLALASAATRRRRIATAPPPTLRRSLRLVPAAIAAICS